MNTTVKKLLSIIFYSVLIYGPPFAVLAENSPEEESPPVNVQKQPVDPQMVKKIQDYLNGIHSYRATLYQRRSDGNQRTGHIYLLKDGKQSYGKLRIEYDPPVKDLIVVNGSEFIFYDDQAREKNTYDIESTPAAFLLRRQINLQGDLKVVEQVKVGENTLWIKVVRSDDESGASMGIEFSTYPMLKLNGWSVVDTNGVVTQVHLEDVNIGIQLDPNLFVWKN